MGNDFLFVEGFQPNRANKRLVRSHAMKGKNVGKILHRPSKLKNSSRRGLRERSPPLNSSAVTRYDAQEACQHVTTIPRNHGDAFLTCGFSLELAPSSVDVINKFFIHIIERVYPTRLGLSPVEAKYVWLRCMFTDETGQPVASRCSIALMDACNEFFLGGNPNSLRGLHYLSQALTLVNERLQGEKALSDSTLSLVISLVLQEELRNELPGAKIHYEGLRQMVKLRGGLHELAGNRPLLLKVCKMDICYALHHGGPLLYFRDRKPPDILPAHRIRAAATIPHPGLELDLFEILLDVVSFVAPLNEFPDLPVYDMHTFQEVMNSICCRLLLFQPLKGPWLCSHQAATYHIGLTIFMMTLFLQHDGRRIWHYPIVSHRFRDVVSYKIPGSDGNDYAYDSLNLWAMLIGGIWVLPDDDGYWLQPKLQALSRRLEIKDFDGVLDRINNLPWINALHDGPARAIWEMVQ
ncbi:hypothetical protein AB5N19_07982 [Seiridium cardinale]